MTGHTRFADPLLFGPKETQVACRACGSDKQAEFTAEIALRFPGPGNLDKPHLLVFPQILVCLICGSAGFTVPESQLQILANEMMPSRGESKTA
jgi:hypothetical protein